ncbi:UNVERIFIED_CONTAM: hypothetical protein FKN15_003906, partial [Acipenser sinensis]
SIDRFCQKTPRQKSHIANLTAKQRVKDFNGQVFEDGGKLFCKTCNVVLDHQRKSTIVNHLTKSQKHLNRIASSQGESQMQRTLSTCFNTTALAQRERLDVVLDWVLTCTAANIPLSKTDHHFVRPRVKNCGAIPGGYQLQDAYLTGVYKTERNKLKDKLIGQERVSYIR